MASIERDKLKLDWKIAVGGYVIAILTVVASTVVTYTNTNKQIRSAKEVTTQQAKSAEDVTTKQGNQTRNLAISNYMNTVAEDQRQFDVAQRRSAYDGLFKAYYAFSNAIDSVTLTLYGGSTHVSQTSILKLTPVIPSASRVFDLFRSFQVKAAPLYTAIQSAYSVASCDARDNLVALRDDVDGMSEGLNDAFYYINQSNERHYVKSVKSFDDKESTLTEDVTSFEDVARTDLLGSPKERC